MTDAIIPDIQQDWFSAYELTQSELDKLTEPNWIIPNLLIETHTLVIPAEAGAGKTTLFMHLSAVMASKNYRVLYINDDISAADAKSAVAQAQTGGFNLLLPGIKKGTSAEQILFDLERLTLSDHDLTGCVFVFDTIKKFANMLDKTSIKNIFKLFRKLNGMNATVVALAHTNKYTVGDSELVFEGVGDLKADCDEMIYLRSHKDPVKEEIIITTEIEKARGQFKPLSFEIDKHRSVSQLHEPLDLEALEKQQQAIAKDQQTLRAVGKYLSTHSGANQKQILSAVQSSQHSERTLKRVLKAYSDMAHTDLPNFWETKRGQGKEVLYFPTHELEDFLAPPS
ncbi:AAA family ATPase [Pseudidiomarina sp. CB1]|uniref:AAA family ATPase n=1 Tax=Pseudidiomarina sp. CB1 TaxID=2972484 RepID=UPI0021624E82|nr:AAA family ATPase [Pseudidiomarina sp. CB1]